MKKWTWMFLLLVLPFSGDAEISEITVKWLNPGVCSDSCVNDMVKQFGVLNGAAEVIVNQGGGQVDIRWKPRVQFSFAPINSAMRMVGPSIHDVRAKVRGTVSHSGSTFTIDSLGDNTHFFLIGAPNPNMNQYTVVHNTDNRPLSDDIQKKLLEAEKNFEVVEIEGPLLDPWRYQILYLVVEKIQLFNLTGAQ